MDSRHVTRIACMGSNVLDVDESVDEVHESWRNAVAGSTRVPVPYPIVLHEKGKPILINPLGISYAYDVELLPF